MHGVTDMGLQDSMVLDCVRTDKVSCFLVFLLCGDAN